MAIREVIAAVLLGTVVGVSANCAPIVNSGVIPYSTREMKWGVVDCRGVELVPAEFVAAYQQLWSASAVLWDDAGTAYGVSRSGKRILLVGSDVGHACRTLHQDYAWIPWVMFGDGDQPGDRVVDLRSGQVVLDERKGVRVNDLYSAVMTLEESESVEVYSASTEANGLLDLRTGEIEWFRSYDDIRQSFDGLMPFKKDKQWGVVDKDGKVIVEPAYRWIEPYLNGKCLASLRVEGHSDRLVCFDREGEKVFDIEFKTIGQPGFSEERLSFMSSKRSHWGYIDESGDVVIPEVFIVCRPFFEGVAAARIPDEEDASIEALCDALEIGETELRKRLGCWVFIDREGRLIRGMPYTSAEPWRSIGGHVYCPKRAFWESGQTGWDVIVDQRGDIIWSSRGGRVDSSPER